MNPIDEHVGAVLRSRRTTASLTASEVASAVGIDPAALVRIEEGRQRAGAAQLQKLCKLFAITPAMIYRDAPGFAQGFGGCVVAEIGRHVRELFGHVGDVGAGLFGTGVCRSRRLAAHVCLPPPEIELETHN